MYTILNFSEMEKRGKFNSIIDIQKMEVKNQIKEGIKKIYDYYEGKKCKWTKEGLQVNSPQEIRQYIDKYGLYVE